MNDTVCFLYSAVYTLTMSFESRVYELIATETAIELRPTSVSIEYGSDSVWKAGKDADILITAKWLGEDVPERFVDEPDKDADTELERLLSTPVIQEEQRHIAINESDSLYDSLDAVLQSIKQSLSLTPPSYIRNCTVSFNSTVPTNSPHSAEWSHELTGDIGGFVGVSVERPHTEASLDLFECVGTVLSEQFTTDSVTSVDSVDFLFSDFKYNECGYCEVSFTTTDPTAFYDVETVSEYIEHIADTETEQEHMAMQDSYELSIRLDISYDDGEVMMGVDYLDDTIQTAAEELLESTVDEFVTTQVSAPLEAESIELTQESQSVSWWHRPQVDYDSIDSL